VTTDKKMKCYPMFHHHVSDKVTIDFNMLHSLMKNKIKQCTWPL